MRDLFDKITEPGVYDLTEEQYHADPCATWSLSASGIKDMLPELGGVPAKYRWRRENPEPEKKSHFDFGKAAHAILLGKGAEIVVVRANDWRTKAAREQREAAWEAGKAPILEAEYEKARAMIDALLKVDVIKAAFAEGKPEQTLIWRDEETGIMCRARLDWLPSAGTIFPDYKTAISANPEDLSRAVDNHAYYVRAAWYLEGLRALGLCEHPTYLFVAQEKEPPYLATPFVLPDTAIQWGAIVVRKAKFEFARCLRSGCWPGYADGVIQIGMPGHAENRLEKAHDRGAFEVMDEFHKPLEAAE